MKNRKQKMENRNEDDADCVMEHNIEHNGCNMKQNRKRKTEHEKQKTENEKQKTENEKQKQGNIKQKMENRNEDDADCVMEHNIEHNGCNMKHCWRWGRAYQGTSPIDLCNP